MKILQVHKHHRPLGGAEKYYLELSSLLKMKGHRVAYFSMHHPNNLASKWEKFFLSQVSFDNMKIGNIPKIFGRMLYSVEARNKIGKLLDKFQPDIVHIHNIYYHISPSILPEIKKRKIPIVYTVHDYHLLTPNITFFHNGKICEKTLGRKFYKAIFHKCVADSFFASIPPSLALSLHHGLGIYEKNVDLFIVPSLFMKKKLVEGGFDGKKIIQIPNFINSEDYKRSDQAAYVLYFGMLYEHKGVQTLVQAASFLPNVKFKVVGDGPYLKNLKRFAKKNGSENIEFLGRLEGKDLRKVIQSSAFCVAPSLWYENMPYSILESFSFGKAVIASKIGGIPEIVQDEKNGLLFRAGDAYDFSQKIKRLWENPGLSQKLGKQAKLLVEQKYTPEIHYKKIINIYKKLSKKSRTG